MNVHALLERIDLTKVWIDNRRPLALEEIRELDAYFRIGTTYSSNALEGNSLTLSETRVLLEDGLTVGGKPLRDCYEAAGHADAYDFMLEVARKKPFVFSADLVLRLHRLFYQRIKPENAGRYRSIQVFITGTDYVPPKPEDVSELMRDFTDTLSRQWECLHPVRLAAFGHRRLVDIHPFTDGNGRTARLLMNLILVNRGYPVASIPPVLRLDYINALRAAQSGTNPSDEKFVRLIAGCVLEAQRDYCRMFHIEPPASPEA